MEVNIEKNLVDMNWTSIDMVKRSDDFYSSLGLPPMPMEFWEKSYFEKSENFGKCHGTAANMFNGNDYRCFFINLKAMNIIILIVNMKFIKDDRMR